MLKKTMAILMSCAFLGTSVPAWAAVSAVSAPVRTVTRTEQSVTVECPVVTGGTKAATDKINSALSSKVASFVSEASTLGGGKVHYDVHRANDNVISLTLVMTPEMGVEETQGMTFDRKTGELRPLSYYYSGPIWKIGPKAAFSTCMTLIRQKQRPFLIRIMSMTMEASSVFTTLVPFSIRARAK